MIRPSQAIVKDYRIRIRGALAVAADERFRRAPDIAPLDVDRVERFLVVPTVIDGQPAVWETSGLQAAAMPADLDDKAPARGSLTAYKIVGARFQAAVRRDAGVLGVPQVHLADIHLAWLPSGGVHGVAVFDLEPAGLGQCTLVLPPTYRLVHATVAGWPAMWERADATRWRLRLGPGQWPQRVEVLFAGRLPASGVFGSGRVFSAPSLADLPVERTLWTIYGPTGQAELPPDLEAARVSSLRQESLRFHTTAALVERASDAVAEGEPQDVQAWRLLWARHFLASKGKITRQLLAPTPNEEFGREEMAAIDQQHRAVAERLGTGDVEARAAAEADRAANAADVWIAASQPSGAATRLAFHSMVGEVAVEAPSEMAGDLAGRVADAAVVLCMSALACLLAAWRPLREWLLRWPHFCCALTGLAWWLWLAPSLVGWVLIAAGVLGSLRSPWRTVRDSRRRSIPLHAAGATLRRT